MNFCTVTTYRNFFNGELEYGAHTVCDFKESLMLGIFCLVKEKVPKLDENLSVKDNIKKTYYLDLVFKGVKLESLNAFRKNSHIVFARKIKESDR